jgi:1-acyl-sn-glycerol-3-phosphate acyltransferase
MRRDAGLLSGLGVVATLRMLGRLAVFVVWTLVLLPVQMVLIRLPGTGKQRLPMRYWGGVARIVGLRLDVSGAVAQGDGRPVIFVANHSSWLDIVALGAVLPGCFVAKAEVARWPGINWVAAAGRTIFVSRRHRAAAGERNAMQERLAAGDNLILFPEGTTSDGARVMPFHPTFLALAGDATRPIVQAVTIVYDRMDGLPICRRNRPLVAWYGDMDIASHYAELGRHDWRARIVIDPPLVVAGGRKQLGAALEARIGAVAAQIRQGRDVEAEASSEKS